MCVAAPRRGTCRTRHALADGAHMSNLPLEPRLVAVTGFMAGEVFPLVGGEITFGRDCDNTIYSADPALSRRHCVFRNLDGQWTVEDLGSSNGTFVNGVQVRTHQLKEGDRIAVGRGVLVFVAAAVPPAGANVDVVESAVPDVTTTLAAGDAVYLQPSSGPNMSRFEQGLRALIRIATVLPTLRTEQELYRELRRILAEIVPAAGAAVVTPHDGNLEVEGAGTTSDPLLVNRTLVDRVLTTRLGVLHQAPTSGVDPVGTPAGGGRSVLCVPIVFRERALGAIYVTSRERSTFDDEHLQLVTAAARLVALALDNVRHLAAVERDAERMHADLQLRHNLVGDSPAMRRAYERLARVARSDTTVLLTGETGTGKELAARAIHLNGTRARRAFVAVNCAALPETLMESELFGHERGAFSGAISQKKGRFELADGGTIFLDEVGELTLGAQVKLLRVLQEREFERLGGTRPLKVDIRVVAATNRTLEEEVQAGRFRSDLLFRLNVVQIKMPPLRERGRDIETLASHFLVKYGDKAGRRVGGFSEEALKALLTYRWPGNVRELENAVERAVVLGSGDMILPDDLPEDVVETSMGAEEPPTQHSYRAAVVHHKRTIVGRALAASGGSYIEAARALKVHPNYLHRLARNLGLRGEE